VLATLPAGYAADTINSTYLLLAGPPLAASVAVDLLIDEVPASWFGRG
jgi:hypothetical protein